MPTTNKQAKHTTGRSADVRDQIKAIVNAELSRLPEVLEGMEPRDRIAVVLKLVPYILPKVGPLEAHYDQPFEATWEDR